MFHHISKHREERNLTRNGVFFDEIRGVWKCDETLSRVLDVFSIKTKITDTVVSMNYTKSHL